MVKEALPVFVSFRLSNWRGVTRAVLVFPPVLLSVSLKCSSPQPEEGAFGAAQDLALELFSNLHWQLESCHHQR